METDMRYKVLFAIQLAILPLIISFKLILGAWAMFIPLILIVMCKVAMMFLKNRANIMHHILEAIGDTAIIVFLAIYFNVLGYVPLWLCVLVSILVVAYEVGNVYFYSKPLPDMIESLDFCFVAFIFATLISATFITITDVVTKVALIAIMLTSAIVVAYKIYRFLNYYIINRESKTSKARAKAEKRKNK